MNGTRVSSASADASHREIPLTDFCAATEESGVDDYAARRASVEEAHALRAMCEASRGRQLRLIRAETDSGRSDGLLNTLTCRQPSAATSLPPQCRRTSFAMRPKLRTLSLSRAEIPRPCTRANLPM